ncbi:MAG: chemotaxis protein CheA [Deltaproteobacteria bacterium]|nr:chemotaxis protein CheA [Deltaproteobacteria bacterium]
MKDLGAATELVDALAFKFVTLDYVDIQGLGVVLNRLDDLADLLNDAGHRALVDLAAGLKAICEKLVLSEHPEPEQAMKQIGDGISLLQELLREADNPEACSKRICGFLDRCGSSKGGDGRGESAGPQGRTQDNSRPELAQDRELLESFVMESLEHLGSIEVNVLSLEQDPDNVEVMNAIFRPFHTIKGVSGFLNLVDINRLAHEVETLLDEARNHKLTVDETFTDLILDAVDMMKGMIDDVRQALETGRTRRADFELDAFLDRLRKIQPAEIGMPELQCVEHSPHGNGTDTGDILVKKGLVTQQDVARALEEQAVSGKRLGEILIERNKVAARDVAGALREQKKLRGISTRAPIKKESVAFVKVDTQKLDDMVDMVGELVITQAMLGQDIRSLAVQHKKLYSNLSQLNRITSEIQRISMSLRMVPIKQTFQKMIRLVRDLAKKSGKLVNLEMVGEDTELDRNMVDEIYDPLVHMVRNAVDHGIEDPEARSAAGKPKAGTVTLRAYHKGGNIVIEISEDGRGLDRDKIIVRARQRGLISSGDNMSDQDVYSLIFQPGFSTADKVTDVSGRGVGMDVVKRAVEKMRGRVEVQSEKGRGTTMLMKLPLTLAIIDGMMVRAGDRNFIIPTMSVVESVRPEPQACTTVAKQGEMIRIRDNLYPLIRLHDLFDFSPEHHHPWEGIVVVAESDGRRKCLLVDELVGKQEVVIKSLGEHLKNIKGMAGGAILSDGRVGLILDVAGLFEAAESQ